MEQQKETKEEAHKKRMRLFISKIRNQCEVVNDAVEALKDNPTNENLDELMIEAAQLSSVIYVAQKNVRSKDISS